MKHSAMVVCSLALLVGVCWAEDELELKDENDRVNYSIGYQIGGDLRRQGIDLSPDALVRGTRDALTGSEPLMTPQEMRTTLMDVKKKIMAAHRKEMSEKGEKNLVEGKAFLDENQKKEGVQTLPSGLQFKVIKEGSGAKPGPEDAVTVHYRGTLIDGTEFDSSYGRGEPSTFQANRVIAGWKEALQMMRPGAQWQLFIPPDLAYGERGAGASIAPNATLIFDVELISVEPAE